MGMSVGGAKRGAFTEMKRGSAYRYSAGFVGDLHGHPEFAGHAGAGTAEFGSAAEAES